VLWLKFIHLSFVVAWFSGLFYLPRLFVYHSQTPDEIGQKRFKVMERKLYYYITFPASLIVLVTGAAMIYEHGHEFFKVNTWLHMKLVFVLGLFIFQGLCWRWMRAFAENKNLHSSKFYRIANEFPTLMLLGIMYLVVFRPM